MARYLRLILLFVVVCAGLGRGHAQTLPALTVDSIDAKVMNAPMIVEGTVHNVTDDPDVNTRRVTFDVIHVLRGNPSSQVEGKVAPCPGYRPKEQWPVREDLEALAKTKARLLIFSGTQDGWTQIVQLQDSKLPIATAEFEILKTPDEILDYVKALIRKRPGAVNLGRTTLAPPFDPQKKKAWLDATGVYGYGGLIVPPDERAEKYAWNSLKDASRITWFRSATMLRPFKSEENIERVRKLLGHPRYEVTIEAEAYNGLEYRDFPLRALANKVLADWGATFQPAETRQIVSRRAEIKSLKTWGGGGGLVEGLSLTWLDEGVKLTTLVFQYGALTDEELLAIARHTQFTHLELIRAKIDDERVKALVGLKELTFLNLDFNPISDQALLVLTKLPNLKEVHVAETGVTPAGIESLRKARPDLSVITVKKADE